VIEGGVGHNLPQEAPNAFVQAIDDVAGSVHLAASAPADAGRS
jgi:hypothetical protein